MPRGFDIFNQQPSTKKEEPLRPTAPTGSYTWFGPPDVVERFRFSVIQENGDDIQLVPGTAKFKKGLTALRWDAPEGGSSTLYTVIKTTPTRIDLRRIGVR